MQYIFNYVVKTKNKKNYTSPYNITCPKQKLLAQTDELLL